MKLTIDQVLLESAEFSHHEDYLRKELGVTPPSSSVGLNVQAQRHETNPTSAALVRLTAKSGDDGVYRFSITYVVFYGMEWGEGEAIPNDLDRRLMVTGANMLFPFIRET